MTKISKVTLAVIISLIVLNLQAQIQKQPNELSVEGYPEITFKEKTHNFGTIKEGEVVETIFEFTNTGGVPLIVSKIKASCGCTVPSGWSKEPIQAGETSTFSVKFDSKNKPHQQSKTIVVHSNTKKGIDYVKIQLLVTPDPDMEAIRVEKAKQRKEHYRMQKEKAATAQHLSDKNKEIKKSGLEQTDKVDERIALEKDRKKAIEAIESLGEAAYVIGEVKTGDKGVELC